MKFKQPDPASLQQQMAPMIDVTFQLLTFFMMTLKISSPEGDFNINMPAATQGSVSPDQLFPDIKVRLVATPDGSLGQLRLGERSLGNDAMAFQRLNNEILKLIGSPGAARTKEMEVEIDADYHLHFENVVKTIGACSGRLSNDGRTIIRYLEKIKFAPPKKNPEG